MLAIDRQQHRTALAHGLHEQRAGHDQRLFIGQQNFLAGLHRRQCRAQTRRTDDGRHDRIDFRIGSDLTQTFLTHQNTGRETRRAQIILQGAGSCDLRHHGKSRDMAHAERQQFTQAGEASQGKDLISIRVTSDDVERAQANRAGRPQNGNLLRAAHGAAIHSSTANTGIAAVRLSIRSSTPP
ncbi:hypothetical protein D9M69_519980 [compost metagenome]